MARRSAKPRRTRESASTNAAPVATTPAEPPAVKTPYLSARRAALIAAALLSLQYGLAASSLVRENPTVDEVAHMPAGLSYWQRGTFRLYPHNPPLVKLVAALPVYLASPVSEPLYTVAAWTGSSPSQADFGQLFAALNADRYFELFTRARLLMPLFATIGGVVIYLWSSRLYGKAGGLLSLALWCFCPNILAHCRLVTSDVGATSLGVAATYLFRRYTLAPTWRRAAAAGIALGLAELTKFSLLTLYVIWPAIWLLNESLTGSREGRLTRVTRAVAHGAFIVVLSILVIDAGYGFEGVGTPLGKFDFASRGLLTRPGVTPRSSPNQLLQLSWKHRVNRFRDTPLADLPCPLPRYYMLGSDEQKIEVDGLPIRWFDPSHPDPDEITGYPVYLNGDLRRHGWWYYYLDTLAYKVPEGTWILVALSLFRLVESRRSRAEWVDELTLLIVPATVLGAMSFLTDICLGLRYILPIFPYLFIGAGKVVPWAAAHPRPTRRLAQALIALSVGLTAAATVSIHPHYLAYFNLVSGGPANGPSHLIDSNVDWGQDLVGLREWLRRNAPDEPVGLAYFGQINPSIFRLRNDPIDWFLPPPRPGTMAPMPASPKLAQARIGPAPRPKPGLYAISVNAAYGLPWRYYDQSPTVWFHAWNAFKPGTYSYFRRFRPIARIGGSIYVYRLSEDDVRSLDDVFRPDDAG